MRGYDEREAFSAIIGLLLLPRTLVFSVGTAWRKLVLDRN